MICAQDIAWVRYGAPDLDLMETFLVDFGLHRVERTASKLFMRANGSEPVVHVTEKGESRAIGFALRAASLGDLETIAREQGAVVAPRDEPGGGHVVVLTDPDDNRIEIVHGYTTQQAAPARTPFAFNPSQDRGRHNATVRVKAQPSQVQRLGHVALYTAKFNEMRAFYLEVLGMQVSDEYYAGNAENTIASFLHCGLKQQFVDHHTVAVVGIGRTGFEHCAFEVTDLDDLMSGNAYLLSRNRWRHSWGIGRHVEGSQIFDYWRDPFGNKIEHWTDGDLVNESYPTGRTEFNPQTSLSQWGPSVTPDFMD